MRFKLFLLSVIISLYSCKNNSTRKNYKEHNQLLHEQKNLNEKPFLKAHLKNGEVIIYADKWSIDTISKTINGIGKRYNFNRDLTSTGEMSLFYSDVAIFETNIKLNKPEHQAISSLAFITTANLALSTFCLVNPKACFGSCPTFYINENDNFHFANAEGFSNAIAPSLEYSDVDALNNDYKQLKSFSLTMKNEALETHCINDVKLLAYPRNKNERVYQSRKNEFYLCDGTYLLSNAISNNSDETTLLQKQDRVERFTKVDDKKLSAKETIYLDFKEIPTDNELGLIINFRQTLMTTYFIYSAMAYMGDEVSDVFSKIENEKNLREKIDLGIKSELGEIEIHVYNDIENKWEKVNSLYETGPIAINQQIVLLNKKSINGTLKLKIILNKGLWRIDYLALTNVIKKVEPIEIDITSVYNKEKIDNASLANLLSDDKYLISMPGDSYKLNFELPREADYELFLYTKGYYLEWMRENWLKDKNLWKLRQMFENPKQYLRSELKNYKEYEKTMEQEFWNSKIDTKNYSYYEN